MNGKGMIPSLFIAPKIKETRVVYSSQRLHNWQHVT